jgi:hypothetical protein
LDLLYTSRDRALTNPQPFACSDLGPVIDDGDECAQVLHAECIGVLRPVFEVGHGYADSA